LIQRIEELENQNKQLIQAEKEFHAEREYYKDIFNNQPAGLYRIKVFPVKKWRNKNWLSSENPPYTMEFASDRFCEIIGVTRNDFFNNPFIISNLVVDEDKKSFARCNENANKKIIPFRWEGRINLKKDVRWIRLNLCPKNWRQVIYCGQAFCMILPSENKPKLL
jgi:PAS domain-containing protein